MQRAENEINDELRSELDEYMEYPPRLRVFSEEGSSEDEDDDEPPPPAPAAEAEGGVGGA